MHTNQSKEDRRVRPRIDCFRAKKRKMIVRFAQTRLLEVKIRIVFFRKIV